MKDDMATWSVKIHRDDHNMLKELAEYRGCSMAALLRQWIRTEARVVKKEKAA